MDRKELGERLLEWHRSSSDPIYAVGSYYFSDMVYPKKEIVENCIRNLTTELTGFQNLPTSAYNDLMIKDLSELVVEAERFLKEDYQ